MARLKKCLVLSGAAFAAAAVAAPPALAGALTPESPHSPNANDISDAYVIVFVIAGLLGLTAIAALVVAMRRFRAGADAPRAGERSGRRVQAYVAAGLAAIAAAIFVIGTIYTESAREIAPTGAEGLADADPLEINVSGQQWMWRYEYPEELKEDAAGPTLFSYHELVVPVDTAVKLNVRSVDVQHRWSVPALGPMATAVPGEINETWFKADQVGTYDGNTTAFAGPASAAMRSRVRVVEPDEFLAWTAQQQADIAEAQQAVADAVSAGEGPGVSG